MSTSQKLKVSPLKPGLRSITHGIKSRPALRRLLYFGWIALWLLILVVGVELISRKYLVPWHQEITYRQMQPYFMSGGYQQTGAAELRDHNVVMGQGGAEVYGYQDSGSMYIYRFDRVVSSIADRGEFLFQDRVDLANDTARTDIIRVFVMGGSAAYGIGASTKEKRWYAVLERALSTALAREVRLVPAAMIGYVSTQERLALDWMVLPRKPDAVVVFDGFNDVVLPAAFGCRPGDPYDQGILYENFYSPLFGLKKWLADHSHFYRYLTQRSLAKALAENERRILEDPQVLSNYARSTASVYLDNVSQMLERCKDEDIPCLVFLQPVRDLTWRYKGIQETLDPITLASYDQILPKIQDLAHRDSIHDLTHAFDGPEQEKVFFDSVHFVDSGHQLIAEAMYPIVLKAIQERLSSPGEGR
jgi:lysophospholipase L1-like esterase